MTLTEFLLARIAEDESLKHGGYPGRVMAEREAKRRIVERYATLADQLTEATTEEPSGHPTLLTSGGIAVGLELALRNLAAVYADHPDFDESWRP